MCESLLSLEDGDLSVMKTPRTEDRDRSNAESAGHIPNMARPLGKAIKILRGRKRWNQSDLETASKGMLSQGYISKIESGSSFPRNDTLAVIVEALGITHAELWALAEKLDASDLDCGAVEEYLTCLVKTGVPFEDVQELFAEVDVQTLARCEQLSTRLSSDSFSDVDLHQFIDLLDLITDKPPVLFRRYFLEVAEVAKKLGEKYCELRRQTA